MKRRFRSHFGSRPTGAHLGRIGALLYFKIPLFYGTDDAVKGNKKVCAPTSSPELTERIRCSDGGRFLLWKAAARSAVVDTVLSRILLQVTY